MLKTETRAAMEFQAAEAEALICRALFELLMAQRQEPMDQFIQRVSATVANA